ncbi:hypothetical protein M1B72_12830 [Geomonas paludis]|uniref:Pilus assembly protein n=1 Tax=Geomonas paludis TaxID=2740185 RepID=A0A6V8MVX4_9BACT|nr:Flp family type IVb pilin [Geomonas paludis]UPU34335.1 hypothetical protein M1B72_12830 [Geomonas paludis]GFO64318.1 hypothetical protein GMPD_22370 [Geomonas paludis]
MAKAKIIPIFLGSKLADRRGQGLVEYALLLVLIAMVIFLMLVAFGRQLNNTYETINSGVQNAGK